jgi:hypothetical protein
VKAARKTLGRRDAGGGEERRGKPQCAKVHGFPPWPCSAERRPENILTRQHFRRRSGREGWFRAV